MVNILHQLDHAPDSRNRRWFLQLMKSLEQETDIWVAAVSDGGALNDDRAWVLLSWIEEAATEIVRQRSFTTLEAAAVARSILTRSSLDSRDIALIESLLHRAAQLAGLSFLDAVTAGCRRAGVLGRAALASLERAAPSTPETHSEEGSGSSFQFRRRPARFNVANLQRWLDQGDQ